MFQARLRVYMQTPFVTVEPMLTTVIDGKRVEIVSADGELPLSRSHWVVFRCGGFATQEDAQEFGEKLRIILRTASICCMWGIDLGREIYDPRPSLFYNRPRPLGDPLNKIHQDVHGLLIVEDIPDLTFVYLEGRRSLQAPPGELLSAINDLSNVDPKLSPDTLNGLRLINQALINTQPLAQLVLAISAVEALGQDQKWTKGQRRLLTNLSESVRADDSLSEDERLEVVAMLDRSHRIGLRQGVKRVLARLGLSDLIGEWDRIYGVRSGIFHGTGRADAIDVSKTAFEATRLCGRIILALAARDGLPLPSVASRHFPGMPVKTD